MKKAIAVLAVLAAVGIAQAAPLWTVWQDNFESYADTAALSPTYTQLYSSYPVQLDTTTGYNSSKSLKLPKTGSNSQYRAYMNLGGEWDGSDDFPLKVEFMMKLSDLVWNTRNYVELRGYTGAGYGDGAYEQILAIGATSSGVPSTAKYIGRMVSGPTGQTGYYNTISDKSLEWTKLTILVKTSTVEWQVNGVTEITKNDNAGRTYDCITIGSGLSSAGSDVWIDNFEVSIMPEPTTLAFLALGGLFLRRRRA